MIIDIRDQLGNQLFSYASIKSVCKDTNQSFGFITNDTCIVNSYDKKYGNTIDGGAFPNIDLSERISLNDLREYSWKEPLKRKSNYLPEVYNLNQEDFLLGHFQCEKYFSKNRKEVLDWFSFDSPIQNKANAQIKSIKKNNKKTISMHLRRGSDYKNSGRLIDLKYYHRALKTLLELKRLSLDEIVVVLFYDADPGEEFKLSLGCETIEPKGTLFEDFALMTLCDFHIISNSTFAWWGAWLDKKEETVVIRPSVYPISFNKFYPDDIFPESWISVKAKSDYLYTYRILQVLKTALKFCYYSLRK